MFSFAVFISGNGSNLQAIINATLNGTIDGKICCVLSNKREAYGLVRAKKANIPTIVIEHDNFIKREDFDDALIKSLEEYKPDLIVLAGFMRILTPNFIKPYQGKLINIHPSLLPKYPGPILIAGTMEVVDPTVMVSSTLLSKFMSGSKISIETTSPEFHSEPMSSVMYSMVANCGICNTPYFTSSNSNTACEPRRAF